MSVNSATIQAKAPLPGETEGREKTESQVNGKEYAILASTDMEIPLANLSISSAAPETIDNQEAPYIWFNQSMDENAPSDYPKAFTLEAINVCLLTPKTHPFWGSAQFKIACCYLKTGNLTEAIRYFGLVPSTHSLFPLALFNIGSCYHNQKQFEKALDHFHDAAHCPSKLWPYYQTEYNAGLYYSGFSLIALKNPRMAIKCFSRISVESEYSSASKIIINKLKNTGLQTCGRKI